MPAIEFLPSTFKSPFHIGVAFLPREAHLGGGISQANQRALHWGQSRTPPHFLYQQVGLVITPLPYSLGMQGHSYQGIYRQGVGEEILSQELSQWLSQCLKPFETEDSLSDDALVEKGRADAIDGKGQLGATGA